MNQAQQQATPDQQREWFEFARDTRIAIAVSLCPDASPAVRPLTTQQIDADGVFTFIVPADGDLANQVAADPKVALAYVDHGSGKYLIVNGTGRVTRDPERAHALWGRINEAFFPKGPDDPSVGILDVTATHLEVWAPHGTRAMQLLRIAAASAGMQVDADKLGRHEAMTVR